MKFWQVWLGAFAAIMIMILFVLGSIDLFTYLDKINGKLAGLTFVLLLTTAISTGAWLSEL